MTDAIRTRGLTKVYRGGTTAVRELDLAVRVGEVFGFLGPNGAGKTTTIRILLDLIRPTSGTARVFLISGDRVEERIVMTGQTVGDRVEIVSGVKAGERVAASGIDQLVDGVKVTVR